MGLSVMSVLALLIGVTYMLLAPCHRIIPIIATVSRLVNTILFKGKELESISSHAWRLKDTNIVAGLLVKYLDSLEKDHCELAYKRDFKLRRVK